MKTVEQVARWNTDGERFDDARQPLPQVGKLAHCGRVTDRKEKLMIDLDLSLHD
jgi:hypothetical protein